MTRYGICLRAFPRAWRERYGEELIALLAESEDGRHWRERRDLVRAGLAERARGPRPPQLSRPARIAVPAALVAAAIVPAALAPASAPRLATRVAAVPTVARRAPVPVAAARLVLVRPLAVRRSGGRAAVPPLRTTIAVRPLVPAPGLRAARVARPVVRRTT